MNANIFAVCEGKPSTTIKTRLHGYYLDAGTKDGAANWDKLRQDRKEVGVKLFDVWGDKHTAGGDERDVELETKFVFDNQWNTACGLRVFDFYRGIVPNRSIKIGHWLEITPEMIELRQKTYKCGYCGAEYYGTKNTGKFCGACLDSSYLKEEDLHLLRVLPVANSKNRAPLTPEEESVLKPEYVKRQTTGKESRANQKRIETRQRIITDCRTTIKRARAERDGLLWLMDRGINTDNVIYYNHTGRFCFGWRNSLSQDVKAELEKRLAGFPFQFDMK